MFPEVVGILQGDLLERNLLYLLPIVDLQYVLVQSGYALPNLPLGRESVALKGRIVLQNGVEGHFVLISAPNV